MLFCCWQGKGVAFYDQIAGEGFFLAVAQDGEGFDGEDGGGLPFWGKLICRDADIGSEPLGVGGFRQKGLAELEGTFRIKNRDFRHAGVGDGDGDEGSVRGPGTLDGAGRSPIRVGFDERLGDAGASPVWRADEDPIFCHDAEAVFFAVLDGWGFLRECVGEYSRSQQPAEEKGAESARKKRGGGICGEVKNQPEARSPKPVCYQVVKKRKGKHIRDGKGC